MKLEVGCIVKFEERYDRGTFWGEITVDIPVNEMSLYHFYVKTFKGETYGCAGHEITENYGKITKKEFYEKHPEKLI